ncbi:MAG: hypothetical protein K2Q45_06665 [Nitrosomonas sp.]|nr:hypothetical protein [Nitrosomonas sp.]
MKVFCNRDLLTYKLLPLLSVLDLNALFLSFKFVLHRYKDIFKLEPQESASHHAFKLRLRKGLETFFSPEDANILMIQLRLGVIILTGGFLLAILNGENVEVCGDIDFLLVFDSKKYYRLWQPMRHLVDEKLKQLKNDFNGRMKPVVRENTAVDYGNRNIAFVHNFTLPQSKKEVQFISIEEKLGDRFPVAQFAKSFDLVFCSNVYANDRLQIFFPTAVQEKSLSLNLFHRYQEHFYETRDNILQQQILERIWSRICKYRKRGYHIALNERIIDVKGQGDYAIVWNKFWADKI